MAEQNVRHWSGPKTTATGASKHYGFNSSYQTKNELTEIEFLNQLDKERRVKYESLNQEGRNLALEIANDSYVRLKGAHETRACGYGTCERNSRFPEYNPNVAVEDASRYMFEKPRRDQNRQLINGYERNTFNPRGQY